MNRFDSSGFKTFTATTTQDAMSLASNYITQLREQQKTGYGIRYLETVVEKDSSTVIIEIIDLAQMKNDYVKQINF